MCDAYYIFMKDHGCFIYGIVKFDLKKICWILGHKLYDIASSDLQYIWIMTPNLARGLDAYPKCGPYDSETVNKVYPRYR